jgi:N-acetyl-gamma-glutamyl-phosphate reductase
VCDLKNGVSGAGRSLKENMLFAERSEDVAGYSQGGKHRHLGEFDQEFSRAAGREVRILFTPASGPGEPRHPASCYVKGDPRAIHAALVGALRPRALLRRPPFGELPAMAMCRAPTSCILACGRPRGGRTLVVSTLDNLNKGSSGQAIQNANLLLGLPETEGLMLAPVFP